LSRLQVQIATKIRRYKVEYLMGLPDQFRCSLLPNWAHSNAPRAFLDQLCEHQLFLS
jgi:hypothetical protein